MSTLGPWSLSEIAPQKSKIRQFINGTSTRCIPASRMVVPILRFRCAGGGQRKCTPSAPVDGQGQRLLRGRPDGIFINPFEIGAIGPDLFRAACNLGLEGLGFKTQRSALSRWQVGRRTASRSSASCHDAGQRCVSMSDPKQEISEEIRKREKMMAILD